MKKAINIRMDEALLADLDNYAHELERSRTYLIEKAVSAYFDALDEKVSDKRIDDLKSGKSEVLSMEDIFQKAGISV
jgi:predicted transcriptional regulator